MSKVADIITRLHGRGAGRVEIRPAARRAGSGRSPLCFRKAAISGDRRAGRGQRADGHALLPCAWLRRCARFQVFLAQALAIGGQYLTAEIPARDVRESRIATAVTDAAIAAIQRAGRRGGYGGSDEGCRTACRWRSRALPRFRRHVVHAGDGNGKPPVPPRHSGQCAGGWAVAAHVCRRHHA